jgi:hypothetical protein
MGSQAVSGCKALVVPPLICLLVALIVRPRGFFIGLTSPAHRGYGGDKKCFSDLPVALSLGCH